MRYSDLSVFWQNGVKVSDGRTIITLDPRRKTEKAVVSHGHMDHLTPGAIMTPQTRDIMVVRKNTSDAECLKYGVESRLGNFTIRLEDAGHVLGYAMVRLNNILYTGDFNPEGGLTSGKAHPKECETLIVEATYGKHEFRIPPRSEVVQSILGWAEDELEYHPIAISGYEFGKAQELIAILNKLDYPVAVPEQIYRISKIYVKHSVPLKFKRISEMNSDDKKSSYVLVVSSKMLKDKNNPAIVALRNEGGTTCYVSGWCTFYNFTSNKVIDLQFSLSDHADFDDLIWFIEQCRPKRVYTVYGSARDLAREVRKRLGIHAEALVENKKKAHWYMRFTGAKWELSKR